MLWLFPEYSCTRFCCQQIPCRGLVQNLWRIKFVTRRRIKDDGTPMIVEIDENKYFHRKYHRGHWRPNHWVLGATERGTGRYCLIKFPKDAMRHFYQLYGNGFCLEAELYANAKHIDDEVFMHDAVGYGRNFVHHYIERVRNSNIRKHLDEL